MRRLVEYKIISGPVQEIRRSYLSMRSVEPKTHRAPKVAGKSSLKKITANEMESKKQCARVINCNFRTGDAHITLKYDNDHVPVDYDHAIEDWAKFMSRVRYAVKKQGIDPETLRIVWSNANWSPKRQAPARYHHHVCVPECMVEIFRRAWKGGGFNVEYLDNRGDHTDLAAYFVDNCRPEKAGQRKWHCSRTCERPIYTEPVEVDDVETIRPEKDAIIKDFYSMPDEEGNIVYTYMRCVLPYRAKVRGGKVIKPRNEKRRKRK